MHQTALYLNIQNKFRNTVEWEGLLHLVFRRAGKQVRLYGDTVNTGDITILKPTNSK